MLYNSFILVLTEFMAHRGTPVVMRGKYMTYRDEIVMLAFLGIMLVMLIADGVARYIGT